MSIDAVIFFVSAIVAVVGATMMITLRNPVLSVMSLIVSLVAQAVLYVQLGALFVGAVLVIVYSGAILVLFLFVIMLLNLRGNEDLGKPSPPLNMVVKYGLTALLLLELVFIIKTTVFRSDTPVGMMADKMKDFGSVEQVATTLFTKYLYPFELTSILLLAAIVGAVVMAKQTNESEMPVEDTELLDNQSDQEEVE